MLTAEGPQVSVVMPVHNALPFLDAAVQSILDQTFRDFEFIILDDASTDGSSERLREWARRDPRIRLLQEKNNLGPALSSDRVARAATTPVIARMDADDISLPTRIAEQLEVMNANPDVGVVGALYDIIDAKDRTIRRAEPWRLLQPASIPPFGNGTMMFRRHVFEEAGGYRSQAEYWEDHDLILRMAAITKVVVLPYSLYKVRQSTASTRFASEIQRVEKAIDLMYRSRRRVAHHQSYDDLLITPAAASDKLDPHVFISLGSVELWAGQTPHLFRRLLRKGDLRFNFHTLSALVWTGWASLEPRTLRAFIRLLLRLRNLRASVLVPTDRPFVWPNEETAAAATTVCVQATEPRELAPAGDSGEEDRIAPERGGSVSARPAAARGAEQVRPQAGGKQQ